jgi:hypothetical protein
MKSFFQERYKKVNIILFATVLLIVILLYGYVELGYCLENCSLELKKGVMNPIFSGGEWLAGILGLLLFVPTHIFKKWLLYIAPVIIILTIYLVQGISIYSGNLLNPSRGQMAENGMILLAAITVVFVVGHLVYDWRKKKLGKNNEQ